MTIADRAVLVTGANRGIGQALVADALRRGARRVYAGTRQPLAHPDGRVTPLTLDVTNPAQIQAAAEQVDALDLLINNAGIWLYDDLSDRAMLEEHLAVNFDGHLGRDPGVAAAADPFQGDDRQQRVADGPGRLAAHAGLLDLQGGRVLPDPVAARPCGRAGRAGAVLTGPVDTDMTRSLDIPKASAASVATGHPRRRGGRGGGHLPRSHVGLAG